MVNILGISCYYHDAAACLIKEGIVIAAAEEERFTRKKHDISFPINAINYCLKEGGITNQQLNYVAFYEKPLLKFERLLSQHLEMFPKSFWSFYKALPSWLNEKLRVPGIIRKKLKYNGDILFIEHHLAHAASCFLVNPFDEAAILTVDGVGEWATASYGYGKSNDITLLKELRFPHSVGLLYSTATAHLGFRVNSHEYKVMGLAPYGKPIYYEDFKKVVDVKNDGSLEFDMSYFDFHYKLTMPSKKFEKEFGPIRKPHEEVTQKHKDIAASLQKITEEILFKMLNYLHKETNMDNLCMAGGVALNSVANGKITRNTPFKKVWVQPAASDAGTSLGAAAYAYNTILGNKRKYVMKSAYLGPSYSTEYIQDFLDKNKIIYKKFKDDNALIKLTAKLIFENNVIGWFQGRMEWGPRALGARSILSNATNPNMKDILNLKVKHRECYDDKTQILTKNGWKLFKDITEDEGVATLNPETKELVYQKIVRKTEYKYSGKIVSFKNKRINLVVTPEHNIWAKKITNHSDSIYKNKFGFEKAINLVGRENIQIKAINKWKGQEKKYFVLPKIRRKKYSHIHQVDKIPMDMWVEFLGYYLSEGSICYDKGKEYEKIKKCLNKIYKWRYSSRSFILGNKQLFEYLKQFGKTKDKFIPQELLGLPERQLKILFDALMCGDGTYRPKQYKYTTVSKKLADNVQELGLKLGYSVTTSKEIPKNPKHNVTYYVRLNKGSKISYVRKNQSSITNYHGKVYCVTVPKYNILCVKRDEKIVFSGNSFRPFAPVISREDVHDYFEIDKDEEKFMLFVYPFKEKVRHLVPSVVHVDGSGRLQTTSKEENPLYYGVIKEFEKLSKVPILVNTSFNIRGEPIVCTPEDAYGCVMGTGIDYLVMDKFLIKRSENPKDMWDSEKIATD